MACATSGPPAESAPGDAHLAFDPVPVRPGPGLAFPRHPHDLNAPEGGVPEGGVDGPCREARHRADHALKHALLGFPHRCPGIAPAGAGRRRGSCPPRSGTRIAWLWWPALSVPIVADSSRPSKGRGGVAKQTPGGRRGTVRERGRTTVRPSATTARVGRGSGCPPARARAGLAATRGPTGRLTSTGRLGPPRFGVRRGRRSISGAWRHTRRQIVVRPARTPRPASLAFSYGASIPRRQGGRAARRIAPPRTWRPSVPSGVGGFRSGVPITSLTAASRRCIALRWLVRCRRRSGAAMRRAAYTLPDAIESDPHRAHPGGAPSRPVRQGEDEPVAPPRPVEDARGTGPPCDRLRVRDCLPGHPVRTGEKASRGDHPDLDANRPDGRAATTQASPLGRGRASSRRASGSPAAQVVKPRRGRLRSARPHRFGCGQAERATGPALVNHGEPILAQALAGADAVTRKGR